MFTFNRNRIPPFSVLSIPMEILEGEGRFLIAASALLTVLGDELPVSTVIENPLNVKSLCTCGQW